MKPDIRFKVCELLYFYANKPPMEVHIEASWKSLLKNEFTQPYFQQVVTFLKTEKAAGKIIYPPGALIFNAFNQTPADKLKVVILGQDPYHGAGQAHGLSSLFPMVLSRRPHWSIFLKKYNLILVYQCLKTMVI